MWRMTGAPAPNLWECYLMSTGVMSPRGWMVNEDEWKWFMNKNYGWKGDEKEISNESWMVENDKWMKTMDEICVIQWWRKIRQMKNGDKMDELKTNEWENMNYSWMNETCWWMKIVNKWNENRRGHMDEKNRNDWLKVDEMKNMDERLWTSLDEQLINSITMEFIVLCWCHWHNERLSYTKVKAKTRRP